MTDAADDLVAGRRLEQPINDFINRCAVAIRDDLAMANPNNFKTCIYYDAIRLAREYIDYATDTGGQPAGKERVVDAGRKPAAPDTEE